MPLFTLGSFPKKRKRYETDSSGENGQGSSGSSSSEKETVEKLEAEKETLENDIGELNVLVKNLEEALKLYKAELSKMNILNHATSMRIAATLTSNQKKPSAELDEPSETDYKVLYDIERRKVEDQLESQKRQRLEKQKNGFYDAYCLEFDSEVRKKEEELKVYFERKRLFDQKKVCREVKDELTRAKQSDLKVCLKCGSMESVDVNCQCGNGHYCSEECKDNHKMIHQPFCMPVNQLIEKHRQGGYFDCTT